MGLSAEQRRNLQVALRTAQRLGASPRERKALVEAMGVESNYTHMRGGDRDSTGILQQRPSMGWGPVGESVATDVAQFLRAAKKVPKGGSAGQLAQAVQRSAFPERYDQRSGEADALLRRYGSGGSVAPRASSSSTQTRTVTTPGVDRSAERQQLKMQYLLNRQDPNALLMLKQGLDQAQDTPSQTTQVRTSGSGSVGGSGGARGASTRSYGTAGRRYSGTEGRIIPFSQRAHRMGLKTTSAKRATRNTTSGNMSDHFAGNKGATARDWAGPPEHMDALARSIASALGVKNFRGGVLNINRGGFRYQLLWKTNVGGNHYDHVHLGVKKL